jgi:predicted RNA-binding protein YlqC (UPF0109 family)
MSIATTLRLSPDCIPSLRAELKDLSKEEVLQKVNEPDEFGDTPLHIAAAAGKLLTVKYLVSNGANINAQNKVGSTPLHKAMIGGTKAVVEYLLENNAEWLTNESGFTPYAYARDILRDNKKFFLTLIAKETDLPVKDTIKVPTHALSIIIGKQGKMLETIRAETQTDVEPPSRSKNQNEKDECQLQLIARSKQDIEQCKKKIERLIEYQEQENKKKVAEEQTKAKKEPEEFKQKKETKKKGQTTVEKPVDVNQIVHNTLNPTPAKEEKKEMFIRFPKDKHGLVIGKNGANIERLKADYDVTIIVPPIAEKKDLITLRGTSLEALKEAKFDILQLLQDGQRGRGRGRGRGGRGRAPGQPDKPDKPYNSERPERQPRYRREEEEQEKEEKPKPKPRPQSLKINLNDANDWPAFG